MEDFGRTRVCSVLFLDIVEYSRRDVAEQVRLKNIFNLVMNSALGHVEPNERVVVDTGDGAAITFLGDPERALRFIPVEEFPLLKDYVGRGVITTATYAARQFGVGSAMGMMKAAKLCPQAIVLPVDFEEVRKYSRLFKSTIDKFADAVQRAGIQKQ